MTTTALKANGPIGIQTRLVFLFMFFHIIYIPIHLNNMIFHFQSKSLISSYWNMHPGAMQDPMMGVSVTIV